MKVHVHIDDECSRGGSPYIIVEMDCVPVVGDKVLLGGVSKIN